MTQPAKGQEPSMEEILASIRRIIADEESADGTPAEAEPAASPPLRAAAPPPRMAPAEGMTREAEIDVMLAHLHEGTRPASPSGEGGRREERFGQSSSEHHVARSADERGGVKETGERGLMSAATTAAVDSAFDALSQAVQPRNGRTLEELVSELIRPMLKTWLDDNLPPMVERLVRDEIERVTRGRG